MDKSSKYHLSNQQIVKYPIITDKATRLLENNQYTFVVDRSSDKITIKSAIEYLFNVKVTKVNKYSIADLIVILSDERSTTNVY